MRNILTTERKEQKQMDTKVNVIGKKMQVTVKGVTLLDVKTAEETPGEILALTKGNWWLKDEGHTSFDVAYVTDDNRIDYDFADQTKGVRPALIIAVKEGERVPLNHEIEYKGRNYTIVSNDRALCNEIISKTYFNDDFGARDMNKYDASVVKKVLKGLEN